jgi:uncharacterized membrane protein YbaN (DUF454 family)
MKINKKGVLGDTTILAVVTVISVVLFVVFFFLTSAITFTKSSEKIQVESLKEQNTASLENYLETTVIAKGNEMKMADLIRLAAVNPNYEAEAIAQTENIFNKVYSAWRFSTTTGLSAGRGAVASQDATASVDIQSSKGKITIRLGVSQ